jgi:hypothetical protein
LGGCHASSSRARRVEPCLTVSPVTSAAICSMQSPPCPEPTWKDYKKSILDSEAHFLRDEYWPPTGISAGAISDRQRPEAAIVGRREPKGLRCRTRKISLAQQIHRFSLRAGLQNRRAGSKGLCQCPASGLRDRTTGASRGPSPGHMPRPNSATMDSAIAVAWSLGEVAEARIGKDLLRSSPTGRLKPRPGGAISSR